MRTRIKARIKSFSVLVVVLLLALLALGARVKYFPSIDVTTNATVGELILEDGLWADSRGAAFSTLKAGLESYAGQDKHVILAANAALSSNPSGDMSGITLQVNKGSVLTLNGTSLIEFNLDVEDGGQVLLDQNCTVNGTIRSRGNTSGVVAFDANTGDETLTINGSIDAGSWQIFGSSLTTDLSNIIHPCKAEWFSTLELAQESDAQHLTINNASWALSATVEFDQDNQIVEFIGQGKISSTLESVDVLLFSGTNAKIINPYMEGPGTSDQTTGTYALIKGTGNNFTVTGGRIVNPYNCGIYTDHADDVSITGVTVTGNISSKINTEHFGIKVEDFINADVSHNIITGVVQGIKITSQAVVSKYANVTHNHIYDCFDHAIYGGAEYENFSHNQISMEETSSGTAIIGQKNYGVYAHNNIYSLHDGGITVRNCSYATIDSNVITIAVSSGSAYGVAFSRTSDGDLSHNKVTNNTIYYTSTGGGRGVSIAPQGSASEVASNNLIANNIIHNPCLDGNAGGIYLYSIGTSKNNKIHGNIILSSGADGIVLTAQSLAAVTNNIIHEANARSVELNTVVDSDISYNKLIDETGGITVNGIREIGACSGNSYLKNDFKLSGLAGSSKLSLTAGSDFKFGALDQGETINLSGATTNFFPVQGNLFFVDPNADGRDFNPLGFYTGAIVTVINTADVAENIEFDQTGINYSIPQNGTAVFGYNGTNWFEINTGSWQ